jgi:hypothetical protein
MIAARLSGWRIWIFGTLWSLAVCLVVAPLFSFVYVYVSDAGPGDIFLTDGRFDVGNGLFGAVIGVLYALFVLFPAASVSAGLFGWWMNRISADGLPSTVMVRRRAVAAGAGVQLVVAVWMGWATGLPGGGGVGGVVLFLAPVLVAAGVAAWLGPHLVRGEVAWQASRSG